ncbi:MAG: ACP S-malonyltransferase [Chloroflexi bacterium]|nr:MAG: ACP S-malonyltransferase [Chloroflexota bacterium]
MPKLAFLYPGQGSQHAGMGADLLQDDEVSALCDKCSSAADVDLRHLLTAANDDELRLTQNAQPALTFMGIGLTTLLARAGHVWAAAAGHSVGEYGALAASHAVVEVALAGIDDAWPANYNTPTQTVIAGTIAGLEAATKRLQEAGAKRVIPLNVSAAFHTPLMAPAAEELRKALDRIEWRRPVITVMANLTGRPHADGDRIPHVLEMQLRSPVRWAACVQGLVEMGCDTFVEVGPKRALTGMMKELAPGAKALSVSTPAAIADLAGLIQ